MTGFWDVAPWQRGGLRIYACPMNQAVKPGAESPQQATGLPVLSVVVPTYNERDNVTGTVPAGWCATLPEIPLGGRLRR